MDLASSLESYDTKTESKFFKNGRSYKEFELLFIPREPGKISIPEVTMSYFDPDQEKYIEQSVPAIELNVSPGKGLAENTSTFDQVNGEVTTELKRVIPDIKMSMESKGFLERNTFNVWIGVYSAALALLGAKALIAFGFVSIRRDFVKDVRERSRRVQKEVASENWREAGAGTHNLINYVLADLTDEQSSSMSIHSMLSKVPSSLRKEIEKPIQKIVPQVEALGFGPDEIMRAIDKSQFRKDFEELIEALVKVAGKAHNYDEKAS